MDLKCANYFKFKENKNQGAQTHDIFQHNLKHEYELKGESFVVSNFIVQNIPIYLNGTHETGLKLENSYFAWLCFVYISF